MWLEKKILVPTDFGEAARAATRVAVQLARRFRVPLVLMHVFGAPGQKYVGVDSVLTADFIRSVESAARLALNEEAAVLAAEGVDVSAVLSQGDAWEQILATAKMVDAGLIVMGTHGRHGVARALLGSVAERTVRLSPVPVLSVHGHSSEEAGA